MTEKEIKAQRAIVEDAAKRFYKLDHEIQVGEITPEKLEELADAYQTYIKVRTTDFREKGFGFLRRLLRV